MFPITPLVLYLAVQSCAADDRGSFQNPPTPNHDTKHEANVVWHLGDRQQLKWITTYTVYNVSLWQQNLTASQANQSVSPIYSYTQNGESSGPGLYDWIVQLYEFDLKVSEVFFLGLNFAGDNTGFTSHYFNISQAMLSPSEPTQSASRQSDVITDIPTHDQKSGLAASEKIGLGLGIGLGIPFLILLAMFIAHKIKIGYQKPANISEPIPNRGQDDTRSVAQKMDCAHIVEAPNGPLERFELYAADDFLTAQPQHSNSTFSRNN